MLQRCCQPPLDVQHHPLLVGVGLHRLDDKIMRNVVEKPGDVTIQHPRVCETTLPACGNRVQRRAARPIPIGARVEPRLHHLLQLPGYHRLGNPVRHGRHPEHPRPPAVRFWYLHRPHRRWEIRPRGHPIHVTYSLFRRSDSNSSTVHPSTPGAPWLAFTFSNASTTACLEITNGLSGDFGWFTRLLPTTGRLTTRTFHGEPSPWLHPHYQGFPATTRRSASGSSNGTQLLAVSAAWSAPSRPASQRRAMSAPAFQRSRQEPQTGFTPPLCRTPSGQYMGTRQTHPGFWNPTRF